MKPVVALVGRPNVGKSTLFNRLTKSRDAIVADSAGLTRDRHYGDARLDGREFIVIDTGGFEPEKPSGVVAEMAKQTKQAVAEADAVVFVTDIRSGVSGQVRNNGIDRVVVSACSPRMHQPTYPKAVQSAGLNPYFFEMSNIREQCSWVHGSKENATKKAMELIASAVAKVSLHEPLEENEVSVTPSVLVVGGGIAGIQTSLDIAHSGFEVYLVEKSPTLGGHLAQIDRTYPNLEESASILLLKMEEVANHPLIHLLTNSEVEEVEGFVGNFKVRIKHGPCYVDPPDRSFR